MAVELENHEFIYLLCEREFTKTEEDIYKIGRTNRKDMAMFADYTKGSLLLFYSFCNNSKVVKNKIINKFKSQFIQRKDIGIDYFEGNH